MHIGTMVEFAFALVAKLDAINKHSFNDFKLRVGTWWRGTVQVWGRHGARDGSLQVSGKSHASVS